MKMVCPYCSGEVQKVRGEKIYPHRPDLHRLKFFLCGPCDAYVGCHAKGKGFKPLGRLANKELRQWKMRAHKEFDPIWRSGRMNRYEAYKWLAEQMGKTSRECHIGKFDVGDCMRVIEIVKLGGIK